MQYFLCTEGPLNGKKIPLPKSGIVALGRQEGSQILLDSPRVSRRHAEVFYQGKCLFLKDLGSQNGTYLNGKKIEPTEFSLAVELKDGDQVSLGDYIFELGSETDSREIPTTEDFAAFSAASSKGVPVRDEDIESKIHLAILYGAYRSLARCEIKEDFYAAIAALTMKIIRCDRICLMDFHPQEQTLYPQYFLNTVEGGTAAHFEPSMMVLHSLVNDKKTIFTVDAGADARFKEGQSIVATGVRSVICSPLLQKSELKGAIYVDTLQSENPLGPQQKQCLEAIADLLLTGAQRYPD